MLALIGYPGTLAGWVVWLALTAVIWAALCLFFCGVCGLNGLPDDARELASEDEEARIRAARRR